MKISVLVDNRPGNTACATEHGLSLYVEHNGTRLLVDFGQSGVFLENAEKLEIDCSDIDAAVLSHGHYDHGNGLKYITNTTIYCHPDCFVKRYSKQDISRYAGISLSRKELAAKNHMVVTDTPSRIAPDIYFLGSIPRIFDFERKISPTCLEDQSEDSLMDDSGIVIHTENGLVIITGCAHSGICNTIEHAKSLWDNPIVHAVIGGFHIRNCDADFQETISYLQRLKSNFILPGHCTCDEACEMLVEQLQESSQVFILGSGNTYTL